MGRNSLTPQRKVAYCFHLTYFHEIYIHPVNPSGHFLSKFYSNRKINGEKNYGHNLNYALK